MSMKQLGGGANSKFSSPYLIDPTYTAKYQLNTRKNTTPGYMSTNSANRLVQINSDSLKTKLNAALGHSQKYSMIQQKNSEETEREFIRILLEKCKYNKHILA